MKSNRRVSGFIFFILGLAILVNSTIEQHDLLVYITRYASTGFLIIAIILSMRLEEFKIRPVFLWLGISLILLWFVCFLVLLWHFQFISIGLKEFL